jgi:DUF1365 family protein
VALASCIYRGVVRHRRYTPVEHRIRLSLFMVYLDLDELDRVFDSSRLWSQRRPNLAWFRRRDHLGDPRVPLDVAVRDLVEERTGRRPEGPVRLLTHLRYFGVCFNPISLFFCHDPAGRIQCVVAEVHNTPWGERHCYVLEEAPGADRKRLHHHTPKAFHVSPFLEMELDYRWFLTAPGRRLALHIENLRGKEKIFDATLSLTRHEIRGNAPFRVLLRYPFMTLQVLLAIYLHAGRLWWKGVPFHRHPRRPRSPENEVQA